MSRGAMSVASTPMMTMTTMISTSVKADRTRRAALLRRE
jgi:hypothetical protein